MSSSAISPDVLRLIEKMSHLTIEEMQEVENFIDFLRSKRENKSHYSDILPHNTKDTSRAKISDFIASFPLSRSDISGMQPQPVSESSLFPLYVPEKSIETNKMSGKSNHVIIAPEEPISEKHPADIDFADINARFAKKREEKREEQNNNETDSKDLDWL